MSGNVLEMCWDWMADLPTSSQTDYQGPGSGSYKIRKGGFRGSDGSGVRISERSFKIAFGSADNFSGFRIIGN